MRKWIIGASLIWGIFGLVTIYLKDWQPLVAIATWVLALGIFFAILQIRETKRSTNAQLAMDLFRELRSDIALERLRYIYSLLPKEDGKYLSSIHKDNIDYVLNRLTMLGHLVERRIIDESLAVEGFSGPAVLRCWHQLFHYIRHTRGERGYYVENYEAFANRCLEYFKNAHIQITFSNEYWKIKYLVTKLDEDKQCRPRSLKQIRRDRKSKEKTKKDSIDG
jgi:hypothetical protein